MRFHTPPAIEHKRVGVTAWFHPDNHPSSAFLWLLRVSSSQAPAVLLRTAAAPGVPPFEVFPYQPTLPSSSLDDPLTTFLAPSRRKVCRAPRGLCRLAVRTHVWSVASSGGPILPSALPLPWLSDNSSWDSLSADHPLMASTSEPFSLIPDADLQRFRLESPGISHSRERRPP